ncbi:MAG: MASE1 domain-containing protein [Myxococcales bacterium]|nr:MASE1 domain-containing protein [Myxococcales bacterium]
MRLNTPSTLVAVLLLAAAYSASAGLGLLVASTPGNVTALWPPSGLALALVLLWGRRCVMGVFLGSFATNLLFFPNVERWSVADIVGSALIAAGSTAEIALASWVLDRFVGGRHAVATRARVALFCGVAFASATVAASVGLFSTAALGGLPVAAWPRFWLTWLVGDGMGMVVVAPFFMLDDAPPRPTRWLEWVVVTAVGLVVAQVVFGRPLPLSDGTTLPLAWLTLPAVVWAGVRLGPRGVAVQTLLLHVLASWGTVRGQGPFAPTGDLALVIVDGLLLVAVVPGLLLSATIAQDAATNASLEHERRVLEERVTERTRAVEQAALEQSRLNATLVEAQKQEAVGRLAGGVAHDFNNLLTVISGHASLLERPLTDDERRDSVQTIFDATSRAAELTRQLLDVARRPLTRSTGVDVADTLRRLRRLLRPALPASITIDIDEPPPGEVALEGVQLEQVLLNLALNARDAMPTGGRLHIATTVRELEASQASAIALPAGRWVRLEVSDDGAGIPAEVLPHLFEPFFTTKGRKGTGLGLSTANGIVASAGGRIDVRSSAGAGTTFTVWLPWVAAKPVVSSEVAAPAPQRGGRLVLVAEDEPLVRSVVVKALTRLGHRVLAASDGEEALAIARQHPDLELLVTDVVMPRLGGVELVKALRARGPIAVLVMSGYHEQQEELRDERVLPKPFTLEAFSKAVGEVLAGASPSRAS